jgi:peptidoglycan/xylan/chitin deacetylase (PgdA/CDA1 family)
VNSALKHLAERALIGSGVELFGRRAKTAATIVLAYHDIVPTGKALAGESSLHLSQREFGRQLDMLRRTHDVVSIDTLGGEPISPTRPRVVITFDDAYAGALAAGVDELEKRGMPATIFIAPALLDSVPWWDALADPGSGMLEDGTREHALNALAGRTEAVLKLAAERRRPSAGSATLPRIATESQIESVASAPGITIGSHTWSHPNLTALPQAELEAEMMLPLTWLKDRFASFVPWLAYPYGLFDAAVERSAETAGYVGAFRIDGGWLPRSAQSHSFALPRFNVTAGLSLEGFRLRAAGIGRGV